MKKAFIYPSIIGDLLIVEEDNKIISVLKSNSIPDDIIKEETLLIKKTSLELFEYFKGDRKEFDIPIKLSGTDFQIKVWECLKKIPYGEVCSYKEISKMIGYIDASRAVGNANNKNKIIILIPCHRVIKSNGNIGGYALGVDIKKKLLEIERKNS